MAILVLSPNTQTKLIRKIHLALFLIFTTPQFSENMARKDNFKISSLSVGFHWGMRVFQDNFSKFPEIK